MLFNANRRITTMTLKLFFMLIVCSSFSPGIDAKAAPQMLCDDFCLIMSQACANSGGTTLTCLTVGAVRVHTCNYNTQAACQSASGYTGPCENTCQAEVDDTCPAVLPIRTCTIRIV
jgi:hypothetical protein